MLIDTHAHVNFNAFMNDAKATLQRALDEGVWVVNVSTQIDTSKQAVELANQFEKGVYAVVGLHPVHTYSQHLDEEESSFQTREENFDASIYKNIAKDSKVVGIGECGLDYYRLPGKSDEALTARKLQRDAFSAQIKLALELKKALVVHSRSAEGTDDACIDVLEMLKQIDHLGYSLDTPIPFVMHSYTGSPGLVVEYLRLGGYISFNGILTFDKTGKMEQILKKTPMDRVVLETDSPYLTPTPHRGKRNEPSYVKHVAEKVAEIKKMSVDEVAEMTTQNAKKLFSL